MRGGAVLADMKEYNDEFVEYKLDEEKGGLLVGDFITNYNSHLLLTKACAEAIVGGFKTGPIELVPARVKNEKGRVHVKDVIVLHPIEALDCLDWEHSDIGGDDSYRLVRIFGKWKLKASSISIELDLMRVKGVPYYIFSERLVDFIKQRGFTNFPFDDVQLS